MQIGTPASQIFQDGRLIWPNSGPESPKNMAKTILESLECVETRFLVHLGVPRHQNCHQGRETYLCPPSLVKSAWCPPCPQPPQFSKIGPIWTPRGLKTSTHPREQEYNIQTPQNPSQKEKSSNKGPFSQAQLTSIGCHGYHANGQDDNQISRDLGLEGIIWKLSLPGSQKSQG